MGESFNTWCRKRWSGDHRKGDLSRAQKTRNVYKAGKEVRNILKGGKRDVSEGTNEEEDRPGTEGKRNNVLPCRGKKSEDADGKQAQNKNKKTVWEAGGGDNAKGHPDKEKGGSYEGSKQTTKRRDVQ